MVYMNNEPPDMPEIAEHNIKTKFLHHRPDGESLARLMTLYSEGHIRLPGITVMDFTEATQAHRQSESSRTQGKLVLKVQDI